MSEIPSPGRVIAQACSRALKGSAANRWHMLTLYQETQLFRLVIKFDSSWPAERPRKSSIVLVNRSDLVQILSDYKPCRDYYHFPDLHPDRAQRIDSAIQSAWNQAAAALVRDSAAWF